jgi:hypothetical protein
MENEKLYEVARKICHEHGMPWTDPRTGQTFPAPGPGMVTDGDILNWCHTIERVEKASAPDSPRAAKRQAVMLEIVRRLRAALVAGVVGGD